MALLLLLAVVMWIALYVGLYLAGTVFLVFADAAVYAWKVRLPAARALVTSAMANGVSLFAVAAVSIPLEFVRVFGPPNGPLRQNYWLLLPLDLVLAVGIQLPMILALNRDCPRRKRLVGVALPLILVTYGFMIGMAALVHVKFY